MQRWVNGLPATERAYYNSYMRSCKARVLRIIRDRGRRAYLVLDRSIFHPLGGGQPSDRGLIEGGSTTFTVKKAILHRNVILHWGAFESREETFDEGDEVLCRIDWDRRYLVMRLHTAGHVLDYALLRFTGRVVETLGAYHGPPRAYLDYNLQGPPDGRLLERFAQEVIEMDLPVRVYEVDADELPKHLHNAPNIDRIPRAEKYRIVSIPRVNSMPCTGTHVGSTGEVGRLTVVRIEDAGRGWRVYYWVD